MDHNKAKEIVGQIIESEPPQISMVNEWVRIVPKEVSKIQLRDGTHIYLDHGHGGWRIRSTRLGIDDEFVYTTLDDALDVVREKQSEMAELGYAEYQPATNGSTEGE